MFSCCGRRSQQLQKKTNEHPPEPDHVARTIPSKAPNTGHENEISYLGPNNANSPERDPPQCHTQEEYLEDNAAHVSNGPLPEEYDFNSSLFMPDPSKKRTSAFELASASYAQATDFNTKNELPSLSEFEEEESGAGLKTKGNENGEGDVNITWKV